MTRTAFWNVVLSLIAALSGGMSDVGFADGTPMRRVLVIGMDGTRPDAIAAAKTPHLDRLIAAGAFSDTTQILGDRYQENDTVSGPGWSSFLTGVWADKHGVNNNSFQGKNYGKYPHFFTLLKQQFPQARTGSFIDWTPIDEHIVSDADVRKSHPAHGADEYTAADKLVMADAVAFLREDDPHAVMAYFGAIDETGHKHGFHPSVPQYVQAIETVDSHIGALLDAMTSRPRFADENWLVIVSTDHGGLGTGHGGGHKVPEIRTTFLIVSGSGVSPGKITEPTFVVDVVGTALVHLGCELKPEWELDGRPIGLAVPAKRN